MQRRNKVEEFVEKLKAKAIDMGATSIGFSKLEEVIPKEFSHLKYGISIVVRLLDEVVNQIEKTPTFTYFHHYRDVNTQIDQICLRLSQMIQEKGYLAMNVPASQTVNDAKEEKYRAIFPHKTAAVMAGLGWVGKNDLFITKEYGPRIRLGTILTTMPLPVEHEIFESLCGNCTACYEECPAGAIKGVNWTRDMQRSEIIDANACSEHMKNAYKNIGRGSVCGLCIKACPWGNKLLKTSLK
jgi:epoxyqueuosine reductase QueG